MTDKTRERALEAVEAWHGALNSGDTDLLVSLSHPDVEIEGPRGSVRGREVLRDWFARATVTLEPGRRFVRGDAVVFEETATWREGETGEKVGEASVATAFRVRDGLVAAIATAICPPPGTAVLFLASRAPLELDALLLIWNVLRAMTRWLLLLILSLHALASLLANIRHAAFPSAGAIQRAVLLLFPSRSTVVT